MFNLTFSEAIVKCLDGEGFIQGSDFADGVYGRERGDRLILVDGNNFHREIGIFPITKELARQKYKLFPVANRQNISK